MHFSSAVSVLNDTWSAGSLEHGRAEMSLTTLAASPTSPGEQEACVFVTDGALSALWQLPQYKSHPSGR